MTAAAAIVVLIIVGGGAYYVGQSTVAPNVSTMTVTATGSTATQTLTQTSTSVLTTTPVNFAFVPQPSNMHPTHPSGVKIRFLKYADPSGVTLDGALWEPQTGQAKVAIITMPGTAGNYSGPPSTFSLGLNGTNRQGYVGEGLSAKGYAVFNAETRAALTPGADSA